MRFRLLSELGNSRRNGLSCLPLKAVSAKTTLLTLVRQVANLNQHRRHLAVQKDPKRRGSHPPITDPTLTVEFLKARDELCMNSPSERPGLLGEGTHFQVRNH